MNEGQIKKRHRNKRKRGASVQNNDTENKVEEVNGEGERDEIEAKKMKKEMETVEVGTDISEEKRLLNEIQAKVKRAKQLKYKAQHEKSAEDIEGAEKSLGGKKNRKRRRKIKRKEIQAAKAAEREEKKKMKKKIKRDEIRASRTPEELKEIKKIKRQHYREKKKQKAAQKKEKSDVSIQN